MGKVSARADGEGLCPYGCRLNLKFDLYPFYDPKNSRIQTTPHPKPKQPSDLTNPHQNPIANNYFTILATDFCREDVSLSIASFPFFALKRRTRRGSEGTPSAISLVTFLLVQESNIINKSKPFFTGGASPSPIG